jgi:metal-responsive CopG/Arc/MetJ family transcriptional regulator
MLRTQIHLDSDLVERLDREAARTGASRAELIRRALRERYAETPDEYEARKKRALDAVFGIWKDRKFRSSEEYLRALRERDTDTLYG